MDCKEVQILSIPHIIGDLDPNLVRYYELEAHLSSCQTCAEEYESTKCAIEFVQAHKAELAQAFESLGKKRAAEQEQLERSWQCIQAKIARIEAQERQDKRAKLRRLLVRVSATAACVAIGVFIFLRFSIQSKPQIAPKPAPQQVVFAPKPSVKVELVSKHGNIPIPANHQITSTDELKMLIINSKHRMVVNIRTSLSIEPLAENAQIGCLVKLTKGRIYTNVRHDGSPFVVDTTHGKAVITGTTFDVKVTDSSTTLLVSNGIVRFESEKGSVDVKAGHISEIAGQSAPTKPIACNTAELTAWATGHEIKNGLAKINLHSDACNFSDLALPVMSGPINLEAIDYEDWIEKNRDWFKRKFPWIFQLKNALAKEGIDVDYPELLVKSGDIWQFVYPESVSARIVVLDSDSLLKLACQYAVGEQWVFEAISNIRLGSDTSANLKRRSTTLEAFEKWMGCFEKARKSSEELDAAFRFRSLRAGSYLANTRTLAWLCAHNEILNCKAEDKAGLLSSLQEQVYTIHNILQATIQLTVSTQNPCSTEYTGLIDQMVENIGVITSCEKRICECEIGR